MYAGVVVMPVLFFSELSGVGGIGVGVLVGGRIEGDGVARCSVRSNKSPYSCMAYTPSRYFFHDNCDQPTPPCRICTGTQCEDRLSRGGRRRRQRTWAATRDLVHQGEAVLEQVAARGAMRPRKRCASGFSYVSVTPGESV